MHKKDDSLGRAILKDKAQGIREKKQQIRERIHKENLAGGVLPSTGLKSILDSTSLDDFLETAALAQRSFESEKGVSQIFNRDVWMLNHKTMNTEDIRKYRSTRIPRRPPWTTDMSVEELDRKERESFLEWRRNVAEAVETEQGNVAPFEKNLSVWRQLWRVIERSDCVVQIVDARNPMLFRCSDIETYAHEISPFKRCVLVLNKADLLPMETRVKWGRYLKSVGIEFAFFSARESEIKKDQVTEKMGELIEELSDDEEAQGGETMEEVEEVEESDDESSDDSPPPSDAQRKNSNKFSLLVDTESEEEEDDDEEEEEDESEEEKEESELVQEEETEKEGNDDESGALDVTQTEEAIVASVTQDSIVTSEADSTPTTTAVDTTAADTTTTTTTTTTTAYSPEELSFSHVFTRTELLTHLQTIAIEAYQQMKCEEKKSQKEDGEESEERRAVIGMLGFPNVGKSSVINVLLGVTPSTHASVRVATGPTPGKTKHLQTAIVSEEVMLCDCPGLVFPVFMNTKADLLFNGILPCSNMREHIEPIRLVCQRVDRSELERVYHIKLPVMKNSEVETYPHPRHVLTEVCKIRGYMASNHSGVNEPRAAIVILKDVLNGVLHWCIDPPKEGVVVDECVDDGVNVKNDERVEEEDRTFETNPEIDPSSSANSEAQQNTGRHQPRQRKVKTGKSEKKMRKEMKKNKAQGKTLTNSMNSKVQIAN